jgi:energy-coupling factor transporter ATP-binding protein EcfA2
MASNQDKSLPDNCIATDLPGLAGKRWVKGVALYGANASGKTTVLKALMALGTMVENSAKMTDPKEPIAQIEPFALAPGQPETPTAFAVAFVAEGVRYEYRIAATRESIWHESLRAFPRAKEQLWFSRDWNAESGSYAWSPERPTGFQRDTQLEGYTLSNMLFLSKAVANNRTELEPVFRWFKEQLEFLYLGAGSIPLRSTTSKMLQEQIPLHDRIVALLRHADIGVTDARIIEKRLTGNVAIGIKLENVPPENRERIPKNLWLMPELTHRVFQRNGESSRRANPVHDAQPLVARRDADAPGSGLVHRQGCRRRSASLSFDGLSAAQGRITGSRLPVRPLRRGAIYSCGVVGVVPGA